MLQIFQKVGDNSYGKNRYLDDFVFLSRYPS